jgi:mRNA degradation ribonuclease J1/J2
MNYHQLHASGHAAQIEIFNMVERMKPGLTIPAHTKAPHLFRKCGSKVKLAKKGVEINLD